MLSTDKEIRLAILKRLHEQFVEDALRLMPVADLLDDLDHLEEEDVKYNIRRMDGTLVNHQTYASSHAGDISITSRGIDELREQGAETILDDDLRYRILEGMYETVRAEGGGMVGFNQDGIAEELEEDETAILRNLVYLEGKGLVENKGGRWDYILLTEMGQEQYENYAEHGTEIPQAGAVDTLHQTVIGPDERDKAENMFRDSAELAREEIIVIDPYAKEELYKMLASVNKRVNIRILTTDKVTGGNYEKMVEEHFAGRDATVKYLPKTQADWPFHDRFVIRDQEKGWHWGHSFHDAGKTMTAVTDMRPINLENSLDQFQKAWDRAQEVVNLER